MAAIVLIRMRLAPVLLTATLAAVAVAANSGEPAGTSPSEIDPPVQGTALLPEQAGESVHDLSRLALTQLRTREFDGAIETWRQVLEKVQTQHGRWDGRNIDPLAGLGAAYQGLGDYHRALEYYEQALHLQRMTHGLHDISQIPLLDRMTEVQARLQAWDQANQLQEYAFYIQQRTHGRDSLDLLPGLYRMAEWYETLGALYSARSLYEDAVEIVETRAGEDDEALIKPLRKLAATYRQERYPTRRAARSDTEPAFRVSAGARPMTDRERQLQHMPLNPYGAGERALERAVEIQQGLDAGDPEEEVDLLLELADWYLLFDRWNQARTTYLQAQLRWRELQAEAENDLADASLLDTPEPLVFPLPDPPRPDRRAGPTVERQGHVEISYDVTDRGRLRNLQVISEDPPELMDVRVRRALRAARFRPRFQDDEAVRADGVIYRHEFSYHAPRDDTESPASGGATGPDE